MDAVFVVMRLVDDLFFQPAFWFVARTLAIWTTTFGRGAAVSG
jgi:hypothetical protein